MSKSDFICQLSCVLNRGTADGLSYFVNKKHDEMIQEFIQYLEAYDSYIGPIQCEQSQALNDSGVDLLLSTEFVKIGFQNLLPISAGLLLIAVFCITRLRKWVEQSHVDDVAETAHGRLPSIGTSDEVTWGGTRTGNGMGG